MNIFGSKSGHLSNRIIGRFFFIFSKHFAVFDDYSKWRVPNGQQNSGKIIKFGEIEENLAFFSIILMARATFGIKNFHSAFIVLPKWTFFLVSLFPCFIMHHHGKYAEISKQ